MMSLSKKTDSIENKFAKNSIIIGLVFLATIALVFISSLTVIKTQITKEIKNNLTSVLNTNHTSITNWADSSLKHAHQVTHYSEIISEINNLLKIKHNKKAILESPELANLRRTFGHYLEDDHHLGFFVVSPGDHINIASMRDNNVGVKNLLSEHKNYLKNIFAGQRELILPLKTDVPLPDKTGKLSLSEPTMFLGVPITDEKENIIAAFLVRVNPTVNFTGITEIAGKGSTGESYLFNKEGLLITESKFDKQLIKAGIIEPSQRGILNVSIKDPGGDMVKGYKPKNRETMPFTKMANNALKGSSSIDVDGYRNYLGVDVVGAWLWDKTYGFGLATEVGYNEAFGSYTEIKNVLIFSFSASAILFIILTLTIISKNNETENINKILSREVLERAQTEEMLTSSREQIELLLNSTAEAIYGIDISGNCTFANNVCAQILGYDSPNEFIGKNMHSLIHHKKNDGSPYPVDECTIYKAYKENRDFYSDLEVLWKKDGTSFPVEFWSHVIDTDGIVSGAVVTFFDITEKKLASQALKESEARLMTAQEIAHIGSWDWDMHSGKLLWSDEIYRIFGISPQSFPATYEAFLEAVHPDDRKLVVNSVNKATGEGEEYNIEHRVIRPDGEVRIVHETGEVFYDNKNRPYRMIGVVSDITEEKRINEELIHSKELAEAANKTKSEFIASMSHELRTPMNAILGMTSLLEQTNLSDMQKEYIEGLNSSGKTLLEIISDILDISKIEAGKLTLDSASFDPTELIDEVCRVLSIKAFSKNIEFLSNIKSPLPKKIKGDGLRLKQVLMNLIGNAIKFTEKGEVDLMATPEYINSGELKILFTIKDSGIGIEKDKINSIFEKFSQADSSTTRKFGGTGLGLDISRNIVELMGGKINVTSRAGQGSTFSFTGRFMVTDGATTASDYDNLKNKKVLILGPNKKINEVLDNYLKTAEIKTTSASDSLKAFEKIKKGENYDVVIVDYLPEKGFGPVLLKKIRSICDPAKILLLTPPNKSEQAVSLAKEMGVNNILTKPLSEHKLYDKLTSLTSGFNIRTTTKNNKPIKLKTNKNILLVEDDEISRLFAKKVLENNGYNVTTATNGREALECFTHKNPDIILMDVSMPEMDGFDATKEIRKIETSSETTDNKKTPIIALTAFTQAEDRQLCLDSGMDDYLTKPIDQNKLLNILELYSRRKQKKAPQIKPAETTHPAFNKKEVLEKTGGDSKLLGEVSDIFINESPVTMEGLEKAINKKDFGAAEKHAHFIKGRLAFLETLKLKHWQILLKDLPEKIK